MIAVDIEGSGTEPHVHSMLSVGAVDLTDPSRTFYGECRAFDGAKIEDEALAVNGFSREQATDQGKQSEAELIRAFIEWATQSADMTLAGQNVSYDRDMLRYAAQRAGHTAYPF